MKYLYIYLFAVNIAAFFMALSDKVRAKKGAWRISEKALFIVAALGGSVGLYIGLLLFRHKTKHLSFMLGIPVIIACQLAAAYYFLYINRG